MKRKKTVTLAILAILILLVAAACDAEENYTEAETSYEAYEEQNTEYEEEEIETGSYLTDPDLYGTGIDENGFLIGVRALDYVELFDYSALPIPANVHQVYEGDIQSNLDSILAEHITSEPVTDREVEHGDTINIDFVGTVDGVEFDGGSTSEAGMYVTIGVTQFIDDFLDQLVGHTPGTVVNVEVTFPDEYHEPSLAGLDALFVTTINYINGEDILPEITDEFVSENFFFQGWFTADDLMEGIHSFLQNDAIMNYLHEYLVTQVTVNYIPERVLVHYEDAFVQQHAQQAEQFGMEIDDLVGMFGFDNLNDFVEASRDDIRNSAIFSLVLQAVAEDAGITSSEQEVIDFLESMQPGGSEMFIEMYGMPWLKQFIRNQATFDYIHENIVLE